MKHPLLRILLLPAFILSVTLSITGCKKANNATIVSVPTVVSSSTIIDVTTTTAQSGGIISANGNAGITANGVCYSATNNTPTTADSKTNDLVSTVAIGDAPFTSSLTGLTPNTTYYLRAYATNSAGTGYGSVIKFTTSSDIASIAGNVTTLAGNGSPGYLDANGTGAMFNNPQGISVDANGNVYVSDSYNNYIRKVTPGGQVSTIAGDGTIGYQDGPVANAEFYDPMGSTFDSQGNLFVADYGNNVIRKITPGGTVSTYAGNGTAGYVDGNTKGDTIEFKNPSGVVFDAAGNLYVTDRGNQLIRKITPTGAVTTVAGIPSLPNAGYLDGTLFGAAFYDPNALTIDANNNLYVADQVNSAIRKVTTPAGVTTTIAGGPKQTNLLNIPVGITSDKTGNLYIVDEGGRLLLYTSSNVLYVLAGGWNISGSADGLGTAAQFNNPQGVAIDANGNIYIADKGNNSIRKVNVVTATH